MTKQEIVNELRKYGVDATTRARKPVLEKLLMEVKKSAVTPMGVQSKGGLGFLFFIIAVSAVIIGVSVS